MRTLPGGTPGAAKMAAPGNRFASCSRVVVGSRRATSTLMATRFFTVLLRFELRMAWAGLMQLEVPCVLQLRCLDLRPGTA